MKEQEKEMAWPEAFALWSAIASATAAGAFVVTALLVGSVNSHGANMWEGAAIFGVFAVLMFWMGRLARRTTRDGSDN